MPYSQIKTCRIFLKSTTYYIPHITYHIYISTQIFVPYTKDFVGSSKGLPRYRSEKSVTEAGGQAQRGRQAEPGTPSDEAEPVAAGPPKESVHLLRGQPRGHMHMYVYTHMYVHVYTHIYIYICICT